MIRRLSIFAIALLALPLSGCWEFSLFSWSPDGRYLVFVDLDEEQAWRWDTVKGQPAPMRGLEDADVMMFQFSSDREAFVLGSNFRASGLFAPEVDGLAKINLTDAYLHEVPPGSRTDGGFAVSPEAQLVATIGTEGEGDGERHILSVAPTDDVNKRRVLAEFKEEIGFPAFDDSGTRLFVTKEVSEEALPENADEGYELVLVEYEGDTVTTRTFARSFTELPIGPRFVGDDAFVYQSATFGDGDLEGVGKVMLQRLDGGEPEVLHEPTFGYFPPSISPDGKTIAVTAVTNAPNDWDKLMQASVQLMSIDLETREKTLLTDEEFGAYGGEFHPAANRIAYATGAEPFCVRILDLDSGHEQLVWRNDEERIFVTAERMLENGETGTALAGLDELLSRFPETEYSSRAAYLRMKIHLASPLNEFDEAVAAFGAIEHSELRAQARPLLWENVDVEASDPQGDCLRNYATDASKAEFEHDSDRTRDLTGLAVRATPNKLYLRVEFDSGYDLGGSVFSDLILLVHRPDREEGVRPVTPYVDWEYPAIRTVIIRHWYPNGQVYDLEVLDSKGNSLARYAGSGFSPPSFPVFDVVDFRDSGTDESGGDFTCWFDREAIGLGRDREYYLQVVTVKGGIESYKGLERPREDTGWDIADAFGDANTRERIDAEDTPVLRGYAVKFRIPGESED